MNMASAGVGKRICKIPLRSLARPNAYLVESKEGWSLIDTGTRGCGIQILKYLRAKGIELKRIVLTHSHMDHIGGMMLLKKMAGVKTFIHAEDAFGFPPFGSPIYPRGWLGVLFRIIERIYTLSPGPVALNTVINGDRIGSLDVIHTHGHTPGSIMLLDSRQKTLFTGDALCTKNETLVLPSQAWSSDWDGLLRSLHRVLDFEFEILLPGHGPAIYEGASGKAKAFIEKVAGGLSG
jgi:glyoxylase-like metal-dependent hydrolase (beta-lactamase superfamily II)